jgi:hypothetical protein
MSYCSLSCASMTAESISGGSNTRRTASSESHGNVGAHESQLGLIGAVGPPREPGFCHLRKGTGMVLQDTLRWWGFLVNGGYACGLCMTNCTGDAGVWSDDAKVLVSKPVAAMTTGDSRHRVRTHVHTHVHTYTCTYTHTSYIHTYRPRQGPGMYICMCVCMYIRSARAGTTQRCFSALPCV